MSTTTPHLGLVKADGDELVNITSQVNDNFDKLDAETLNHSDRLSVIESEAGIDEWTAWTPSQLRIGTNSITGATTKVFEFKRSGDVVYCSVRIVGIPAATYNLNHFNFTLPFVLAARGGFAGNAVLAKANSPQAATTNLDYSNIKIEADTSHVGFYQKTDNAFDGFLDLVIGIEGSCFSAEFYYRTTGVAIA